MEARFADDETLHSWQSVQMKKDEPGVVIFCFTWNFESSLIIPEEGFHFK